MSQNIFISLSVGCVSIQNNLTYLKYSWITLSQTHEGNKKIWNKGDQDIAHNNDWKVI